MKVVWASTRRAVGAADSFAANTTARYLLSDVWKSVDAPLQEFSSAHIVALELPPVVQLGYEHSVLSIVQKMLAVGTQVLMIVQPSLRRKSNKALWVHKWNFLEHAPM